jgi:hypothetical protein
MLNFRLIKSIKAIVKKGHIYILCLLLNKYQNSIKPLLRRVLKAVILFG